MKRQVDNLDEISPTDANLTYFVSGCIGRSICRRKKCSEYKHLLLSDKNNELSVDDHLPEGCKKLFKHADRGGLVAPSELCYATTALAVQSYTAVNLNEDMKKRLMAADNSRSLFVASLSQSVQSRPLLAQLANQKCPIDHYNFELII